MRGKRSGFQRYTTNRGFELRSSGPRHLVYPSHVVRSGAASGSCWGGAPTAGRRVDTRVSPGHLAVVCVSACCALSPAARRCCERARRARAAPRPLAGRAATPRAPPAPRRRRRCPCTPPGSPAARPPPPAARSASSHPLDHPRKRLRKTRRALGWRACDSNQRTRGCTHAHRLCQRESLLARGHV